VCVVCETNGDDFVCTGRTLEETAALFDGDEQQRELASTGGRAIRMSTLTYHGTIAVYKTKSSL
jgi:hypothetical protein